MERAKIKACIRLILEGKYPDVINLLKQNDKGSEISLGIRFAIEGIIDFASDRTKEAYLHDPKNLGRLRHLFRDRLKSVWSDDFDKDYFETWVYFISSLQRKTRSKSH
ncbi:MAG: hypothetical protein HXX80_05030 [Nitrososphaerales archaeon]|nr:hypothetical protein [Nitrososphaerales archaeon]